MQLIGHFHSIYKLAQVHKVKLVTAMICSICAGLIGLIPFFLIAELGASLFNKTITPDALFSTVLIICGVLVLRYVFLAIAKTLFHLVAYFTMYDLQISLAEKIGHMPLGAVTKEGSAKLKKTIIQDTDVLHTIIGHYIEDFLTGIVVPVATLIAFFYVDWQMGLVAAALIPALYWGHMQSFKNFDEEAEAYFKADEHMQASYNEYVNGIAAVKIFNRNLSQKLIKATQDHVTHVVDWTKKTIFAWAAFNSAAESTLLFLLPAGLFMLMNGMITVEVFFFFLLLGTNFLQPFVRLASQVGLLNMAAKSIERIEEILNSHSLEVSQNTKIPSNTDIEICNVDFCHGDVKTLENISLDIKQGQLCALVGPSGAGKSTLAQLIGRFWDVNSGAIKIGGVDVRDMSEETLYAHVAFVFQDVFLFNDTVLENLKMARPDASEEEVVKACQAARAHEFIMQLPQGYHSRVGENGALLSGGQKQRLSIARALLRDAPILILDEATSYADPINEADIQHALSHLMKGRTVVMIAHRLHTIANADQIVVLKNGKIAAIGTHERLAESSKLYKALWLDYRQSLQTQDQIIKRQAA